MSEITERNYNEAGDRLDEARVVVFDIADAMLTGQQVISLEGQGASSALSCGHVGRLFAGPHRPCLGLQMAEVIAADTTAA